MNSHWRRVLPWLLSLPAALYPASACARTWTVVDAPWATPATTSSTPVPFTTADPPVTADNPQPIQAATSPPSIRLRESLRIPPLVARRQSWPPPSLSPGVPSSFIAQWGDVFISASAATAGQQRNGTIDGAWSAGFGLGDAAAAVAMEVSGGCGSVNNFCANGSFDVKVSRLLINQATSRLALSAAWQNVAQWGNEGRQDNTFYGGLTYAMPLDPGHPAFERTLQINAGVGNSRYAPYSPSNSENQIGAFASIGVELAPNLGIAAGWSGRGANAQFSITPFRELPVTLNLLGADLFNQTPAGTVGVLSISWGTNFRTARFD